ATSSIAIPGAYSNEDGWANTLAIEAAAEPSVHPAVQFCRSLTIGGFDDWYLGSIRETEILYRVFKPGSISNNTSSGANPSAVPPTGNYHTTDPEQTSVLPFRAGNPEAFTEGTYWTSSQYTGTNASFQDFNNGL